MTFRSSVAAVFGTIQLLVWLSGTSADTPCWPRDLGDSSSPDHSVVCVCNATYCDDVTRLAPALGAYVVYTSSQDGLRFSKTTGKLQSSSSIGLPAVSSVNTLEIRPGQQHQTIEGFGGSPTDSTGINWLSLPQGARDYFIQSYCSVQGLEYNMMRIPIGGADFSTHPYAYNESPEDDRFLSNYSLSYEDYAYKIPLIKACMEVATSTVHLIATTWSPPNWMKTNDNVTGVGFLRREYYDTYALYHTKFIQQYADNDVLVWAITTTNEPQDGLGTVIAINDMGWTAETMGKWIVQNLGPEMERKWPDVKILGSDDQRPTISYWFETVVKKYPEALKYIDGIATHWYKDMETPPEVLSQVATKYPDKFILSTEACTGFKPEDTDVTLGNWTRGKEYALDILEDLNHAVVGWIDWNMILDQQGGPNWINNFVDSPMIAFADEGEFVKQPMFYAMGHFSKFLPRGSVRVEVIASPQQQAIKHVAVVTPRDTIAVVMYHDADCETTVALKLDGKQAAVTLPANSIVTVEISYESKAAPAPPPPSTQAHAYAVSSA